MIFAKCRFNNKETCIWSGTCLPLPPTITFLEIQNCRWIMQRADPVLCSLLFVSLSLALLTHDIQESNRIQTCSCAHTVKGAWGILLAWCACKIGEFHIPCICSSFSHAFVAASISNHSGQQWTTKITDQWQTAAHHIWGVTGLLGKAHTYQWTSFHPHAGYRLN